ncbi:hypothetical protein LCGC14_2912550, partial [marine sediment metagenome]
ATFEGVINLRNMMMSAQKGVATNG